MWSIVRDLQAKVAPAVANNVQLDKAASSSEPSCSAAHGQQQAHDGEAAAVAPAGGEGKTEEVARDEPLAATLLVAPRVHPFNAALFENLALNLAIALKQTPIMDRIEVEVRNTTLLPDEGPALVPVPQYMVLSYTVSCVAMVCRQLMTVHYSFHMY